jgi:hypothetical protein
MNSSPILGFSVAEKPGMNSFEALGFPVRGRPA